MLHLYSRRLTSVPWRGISFKWQLSLVHQTNALNTNNQKCLQRNCTRLGWGLSDTCSWVCSTFNQKSWKCTFQMSWLRINQHFGVESKILTKRFFPWIKDTNHISWYYWSLQTNFKYWAAVQAHGGKQNSKFLLEAFIFSYCTPLSAACSETRGLLHSFSKLWNILVFKYHVWQTVI